MDSLDLAQEIDRRAGEAGRQQNVLLEVNIGKEPTKAGFHPDDVLQSVPMMAQLSHTCIRGLMAIPLPTRSRPGRLSVNSVISLGRFRS